MKSFISVLMLLTVFNVKAIEHQIKVYENRFEPEVVVATQGDVITWQVIDGRHQIATPDSQSSWSFTSPVLTNGNTYSIQVETTDSFEVTYGSSQDPLLSGALVIENDQPTFTIGPSINAHYYNPQTAGQGLLLEYIPTSNQVLAYWFTYDSDQQQRWMLGTGTPDGHQVTLEMNATTGGQLNSDQAISTIPWGELTLVFHDCQSATAYYNGREEQLSGSFPLQRLYLAELCQ